MDDHMRISQFRMGESSAEPKHMIHLKGVDLTVTASLDPRFYLTGQRYDPGRRAHDPRCLA